MLIIFYTLWLCHASILKTSRFYNLSRRILSASFQPFDKIPQRIEAHHFGSEIEVSANHGWLYKGLEKECQKGYDREPTLESFRLMSRLGKRSAKYLICTALNACAKTFNLRLGFQLHACIIQLGYEHNLVLNTALVDLYAKCDAVVDARRGFYGLERHDRVSWTSIICGFSKSGHQREAILMFKDMLGTQIKPNAYTYVGVISACSELQEGLEQGSLLHAHVFKLGFGKNNFVVSSLIDCYSKRGEIVQAALVFCETTERDGIHLSSMISGYLKNLYSEEALKLFTETRNMNLSPNDHTLKSVFNACGSLKVL